jgi:hypothetical protein
MIERICNRFFTEIFQFQLSKSYGTIVYFSGSKLISKIHSNIDSKLLKTFISDIDLWLADSASSFKALSKVALHITTMIVFYDIPSSQPGRLEAWSPNTWKVRLVTVYVANRKNYN